MDDLAEDFSVLEQQLKEIEDEKKKTNFLKQKNYEKALRWNSQTTEQEGTVEKQTTGKSQIKTLQEENLRLQDENVKLQDKNKA